MIETSYLRITKAAEILETDIDTLLIAAVEQRIRLYVFLGNILLVPVGSFEARCDGEPEWIPASANAKRSRPTLGWIDKWGAIDLLRTGKTSSYNLLLEDDDPPEADEGCEEDDPASMEPIGLEVVLVRRKDIQRSEHDDFAEKHSRDTSNLPRDNVLQACASGDARLTLEEITEERNALREELALVTKERDEAKAEEARRYDCYWTEWEIRKIVTDERDQEREQSAKLAAEVERLRAENAALRTAGQSGPASISSPHINSPTMRRIVQAVEQYPAWREAQCQEPNLKALLGWQDVQQKGRGNASRVAHVAHHVIAEHFGLKD